MATVLLSAAGSAVGSSIGGSVLGVGAAALGKAAGAVAGSLIDQRILGQGSRAVEVGRARSLQLQSGAEGAPINRVFGRMRVTGQVIWSTRFLERQKTTRRGGKGTGGQSVREFSYSISFAIGLCEGSIDRIGRVWADGSEIDPRRYEMRIYRGDADQLPDPKIEAVEGSGQAPAYRGLAYVVFEDFDVSGFGNRIPQLSFEVFRSRSSEAGPPSSPEAGRPLSELIAAVALSPGTGEFALDPEPVRYLLPNRTAEFANVHNSQGRADIDLSLEQLDAELPSCNAVSLIVSWFGTDLRCGHCAVEPRIERRERVGSPVPWKVAGQDVNTATLVSRDAEGRPNFGGTPSDSSVVNVIASLNQRGKSVLLYPFLLMDIPPGSGLPDPYGTAPEQAAFPWRGRITLDHAPGSAGSADQTPVAEADVAAFFGAAAASDFSIVDGTVVYSGPVEWSWRRFVLHLAALGKAAGGVDAICVGTELRGLTQIRSGKTTYPAVAALRDLAAEVRVLLPTSKISYAADWSEYFGHQPVDGSGDVIFHLDPLWADPNVDFIGIDDYTPLSDWRHASSHLDLENGHKSVYSLEYLSSNVEGGEYYDWYYAGDAARRSQLRLPISDGAHSEDWIFRAKDIRNWWSNAHHDRVDGVRSASPTSWIPESKPIWLTELGCPAIDLGSNEPNIFFDGKSSESGLPYGSRGARDEEIQRRFHQAKIGYWNDDAKNPISTVYGGRMLPTDRIFVWTWDARPWPDFPVRESVWADGPSHRKGHWITGRVLSGALADVVAEICFLGGLTEVSVDELHGIVHGYLLSSTGSIRAALQPLMTAYGFDCFEADGLIRFRMRGSVSSVTIDSARLVEGEEAGRSLQVQSGSAGERVDVMRLQYVQGEADYRLSSVETRNADASADRTAETSLQLNLPSSTAQAVCDRWFAEAAESTVEARLSLPRSMLSLTATDIVSTEESASKLDWRIERVSVGDAIEIEATRVMTSAHRPLARAESVAEQALQAQFGPISAVLLNLPLADGSLRDHRPFLAVTATPWAGPSSVYHHRLGGSLEELVRVDRPAVIGSLRSVLPPGLPNRINRIAIEVNVADGSLRSAEFMDLLNGANLAAIQANDTEWELVQFERATQIESGVYELSGLLRGQRGTEALALTETAAGAQIVLLDNAIIELPLGLDQVGEEIRLRIGPARLAPSHPAFIDLNAEALMTGLRPFAPAHLEVSTDSASGDARITWTRRSRVGGDNWALFDVPLAEDRERYRVTIREQGLVLRVDEVKESWFNYSAEMQSADGRLGPIEISVAQISDAFGSGTERTVITDE